MLEPGHWQNARRVDSEESGYLQRVDDEALMKLAVEHDLQCKLERTPGQFVARDAPLLRVVPPEKLTAEIAGRFRECFSLGTHRTRHQDPLYSIQQLVEISAHALSPGINEPFTAQTCIDWLGASLRRVLARELPASERYDEAGKLRFVAEAMTFERLWRAAFDQIRIYGASSPDVLMSLLGIIVGLAPDLRSDAQRTVLAQYTQVIGADAETQIKNDVDRTRVAAQVKHTLGVLASSPNVK